ncbi:MAG: hypothetical protein ACE5HX_06360 [bacterium]
MPDRQGVGFPRVPFGAIVLILFTLAFTSACKNREHLREGRTEHAGEEESGQTFTLNETYDKVRKGVRLILAYDQESSSFIGTVQNVTYKTIKLVRVEVHLSNGTELGPTKPVDLTSGQKTNVKLSAARQAFNWWQAHPEAGSAEHGEGAHSEEPSHDEHSGESEVEQ